MLRRILYLSTLVGVLMSFSHAHAQFTFSDKDVTIDLEEGVETFGYIFVNYRDSNPGNATWRIISTDFDWTQWEIQFCECSSCYTNEFGMIPNTISCSNIPNNIDVEWKVGIKPPAGTMAVGSFEIELEDLGTGAKDTLTWTTQIANSVQDLSSGVSNLKPVYRDQTVDFIYNGSGVVNVDVLSVTGAVVHSQQFEEGLNTLNMPQAMNGMYILRTSEGEQLKFVLR